MAEIAPFYDALADVYDAWLRKRTREKEPPTPEGFYLELAREADEPVLEVGVGTGPVYLDLLADGIDVDGIDVSERMVELTRGKAEERGLDPSVRVADVTDFEPDREYGFVYAARVFTDLPTLADQRAAVETVREALAPGGLFALDAIVPSFEYVAERFGESSEEVVEVDGVPHRVVMRTELDDEVEQVARWYWEVYRDGDLVAEADVPTPLISKREFEHLFEFAGFDDWTAYGDFDRSPLEPGATDMIWVAEA